MGIQSVSASGGGAVAICGSGCDDASRLLCFYMLSAASINYTSSVCCGWGGRELFQVSGNRYAFLGSNVQGFRGSTTSEERELKGGEMKDDF